MRAVAEEPMGYLAVAALNFSDHDELRIEVGEEVPAKLVEQWMIDDFTVADDSVDWQSLGALSDEQRAELAAMPPQEKPKSKSKASAAAQRDGNA